MLNGLKSACAQHTIRVKARRVNGLRHPWSGDEDLPRDDIRRNGIRSAPSSENYRVAIVLSYHHHHHWGTCKNFAVLETRVGIAIRILCICIFIVYAFGSRLTHNNSEWETGHG
jgi:hypothetical protein